jgi:uncharacterized membrane protein
VSAETWSAVCETIRGEFQAGRFTAGVVAAIESVGRIIGQQFPQRPGQRDEDELPNRPAMI